MDFRENYLAALTFGKPARVPFWPGGPRESTLRTWHQQGFPKGKGVSEVLSEELGIEPMEGGFWSPGVDFRMIPTFKEKVLEHRNGHYIVRDWMGAICEISDEYDYTYIRQAKDFVTRRWHKFPVESRVDWEQMKQRYAVDATGRFPADFAERCLKVDRTHNVTSVQVNGPFWQVREWVGFEGLCILMADEPDFVHEMVDCWSDFVASVLERILEHTVIDRLGISEDMAYKAHCMISPGMVREFLMPVWKRWVKLVHKAGCQVIDMDSDGYIGELIPLWIEAGINVCSPMEVAAGNDIVAFRREFGRRMGYWGSIDKRALAKGGKVMEAELERVVLPLMEEGGFIPSCDHGVPADVAWPDFLAYARKLAELLGWI